MPGVIAIPALALVLTLPAFITAEYKAGRWLVFPLKLLCSLCFTAAGLLAITAKSGTTYGGLIMAGLIFSLVGDLTLVWVNVRRAFLIGLVVFLLAQVLYTIAFIVANGPSLWDLPVYALLIGLILAAYRHLDMDLGRMKIPVLAYVLVISAMLTKAISSLYSGGMISPASWLAVSGAGLFFISDAILALNKFQRKPAGWYRAANLITYYLGQMLIAASVFYYV